MATITNTIRWADNTAELKKNLLDGTDSLNAMRQQVDRTVQSLSGAGLLGTANKVAAAITQMGSVTKLTAAEQQRALAVIDKAIEKYQALGQVAPKALTDIADALRPHQGIFAGMVGGLQSLGTSWVARITEGILLRDAIRGILSQVKDLASFLPELAMKGAGIADVEENFNHLTKAAGLAGEALMGRLREGTHNTVDNFALMKTVNKDLAAGMALTEKQFGTLAKGAFALAQATGGDVKTAFDTMNDAMLTGRTRSLAELTGKIQTTAAEEKFAAAMKHSADQLTEEGKLEAARAAILEAVTEATARLGEQTDGLDEKVAQVSVAWENFKDDLGKTIATSETLTIAFDGVRDILAEAFGGDKKKLFDAIATAVDELTIKVVELGASGVEAGGFMAKEWYAAIKVFGDVIQVVDGVRLAFLYANREIGRARSVTTGIFDETLQAQIKATDDQIGELLVTMKKRGDALQEADKAQSQVDATTAKYVKRLEDLKAKVEGVQAASAAARAEEAAFVGPLQDEADAQAKAAAAAKKHADELFKANEFQKKFAEIMGELNSVGIGWRGTLETIDGTFVEAIKYYLQAGVAQDKLATAYGLTAAQIHAVAESLKEEAEIRKIIDAATKSSSDSVRTWIADTAKAAGEYVKANTTAYAHALEIAEKTNDEIALSGVSGKMREIRALEQKEQAEIDALAFLRREYPKVYDEIVILVKRKYGILKAEAIQTTGDIIDVAHQLGLKTKEDIATNLGLARNNYVALKNSGVLSLGELAKAWRLLKQAEEDAGIASETALGKAVGIAESLGPVLQKALNSNSAALKLLGAVGLDVVQVLKTVDEQSQRTAKGLKLSTADMAQAAVSWGTMIFSLVTALGDYIDGLEKARNAQQALMDTRLIGLDFTAPKGMVRAVEISRDLQRAIYDLEVSLKKSDALRDLMAPGRGADNTQLARVVAEALKLTDIIAELGGVAKLSAEDLGTITNRMRVLLATIQAGGPLAVDALKSLDSTMRLFGDRAIATNGLVSQSFLDMAADAKAAGVELQSVADFNAAMSDKLVGGLASAAKKLPEAGAAFAEVFAGLSKTRREQLEKDFEAAKKGNDAFKQTFEQWAVQQAGLYQHLAEGDGALQTYFEAEGVRASEVFGKYQASFDRISRITLASFNAMVAGGKTPLDAIAAIGGSIDILKEKQQSLGLQGNAAFNQLSRFRDLASANEGLVASVSGLNDIMLALANTGSLDADTFADLQAEGVDSFNKLTAAGFSQKEAEAQLKPLLENIIQLHKDKGLAIDEATQKLIDQATEDGILSAKQASTQDVLKEGLGAIIKLLGGDLPKAWQDMADKAKASAKDAADGTQKALDRVKAPDLTVHVGYVFDDSPEAPRPGPGGGAFRGGLVTSYGVQRLVGGGLVRALASGGTIGSLMPSGTDTVPAMLTPGESVLTRAATSALGTDAIGAMNRGARVGGVQTLVLQENNTFSLPNLQVLDGSDLDRMVEKKIMPRFMNELEDHRRGYAGRMARVVKEING